MNDYIISDLHLFHKNILDICDRPFKDLEHMHFQMIEWWNYVVEPEDRVFVLGDVWFKPEGQFVIKKMNGHKILISGNHDTDYLKYYTAAGFNNIKGAHNYHCPVTRKRIIMTHIPIHEDCLSRWDYNFHGHLHHNVIFHPKYVNVSCEKLDYRPRLIADLISNRMELQEQLKKGIEEDL